MFFGVRIFRSIKYRLMSKYIYCYLMPLRRVKLGLGRNCTVRLGKNIRSQGHGDIICGNNCHIQDNTSFCFNPIDGKTPQIRIGNGSSIGKYNDFGCSRLIEIEENVITAPFVHFTDRNHCYKDIETPIMHQPTSVKGPIRVGASSWLGFGVQIMSGVSIGKHCIIAAGSIVTKDIPDYSVAGGNPARVIKKYNFDSKKWEMQ